MTLRDDVRAMLAGTAGEPDMSDAAAAGPDLADLPPDLAGTAIGHFADTASIADADALAPIAMAAGPVPFDPELDDLGDPAEPFAAVDRLDVDPAALDGTGDRDDVDDPSDFDARETTEPIEMTETIEGAHAADPTSEPADPTGADESFGSGSVVDASTEPFRDEAPAPTTEGFEDDVSFVDSNADDPFAVVEAVGHESMIDVDPVDLDAGDGHDPIDDDLDFAD